MKRILAILCVGLSVTACTSMSEADWNNSKAILQGSPAIKRDTINDCIARQRKEPLAERKSDAAFVNASLADAPKVFCERMIKAWASGRITYKDYLSLSASNADISKVILIMQGK